MRLACGGRPAAAPQTFSTKVRRSYRPPVQPPFAKSAAVTLLLRVEAARPAPKVTKPLVIIDRRAIRHFRLTFDTNPSREHHLARQPDAFALPRDHTVGHAALTSCSAEQKPSGPTSPHPGLPDRPGSPLKTLGLLPGRPTRLDSTAAPHAVRPDPQAQLSMPSPDTRSASPPPLHAVVSQASPLTQPEMPAAYVRVCQGVRRLRAPRSRGSF